MEERQNGSSVFSNFIWRFLERSGAQGVQFIVELVLARLLSPDDYGTIALVALFINILNVFVDSGLGTALIQKKDADDVDFSSVFYFNVVWCMAIYALLFSVSPFISSFYERSELTAVIRVLGITVLISGVKNVQQAYVSCTMQFKKFFFATLGGTLTAAVVGIVMAHNGFGVWALVAQLLINSLIDTVILWLSVRWRPKIIFSVSRLRALFAYGWKLLVSGLIDKIYSEMYQLVIGKKYSATDLAYYNKGDQFPRTIISNIDSSIDSVLLPTMSHVQSDTAAVRDMTRKAIKTSTYIMAPIMMGMCFVAPALVRVLLTEKWLPCVPYLRICCVTYMFYPIHTANLNAIKAIGRSDLFLKLEICKKTIGIVVLGITMWFGIKAMVYSLLFTSITSQMINSWPNRKLLGYSYPAQLKDILPSVALSIGMGGCVSLLALLNLPVLFQLVLQVLAGAVIYIAGSVLLGIDSFRYLYDILRKLLLGTRDKT